MEEMMTIFRHNILLQFVGIESMTTWSKAIYEPF